MDSRFGLMQFCRTCILVMPSNVFLQGMRQRVIYPNVGQVIGNQRLVAELALHILVMFFLGPDTKRRTGPPTADADVRLFLDAVLL